MSNRFVKPEIVQLPELEASDIRRWQELRRMYLSQKIPGMIVRGLPSLAKQALFDLGGVSEYSTTESAAAINYAFPAGYALSHGDDLGLHFDTGKVTPNKATANRIEIGEVSIKLIEGTEDFTKSWGDDYKRYPEVPAEAADAYNEGLVDTEVFTPVMYVGEAGVSDLIFSRNHTGNVLAHDIVTLTPTRLSFISGVLLEL